MKLARAALLVAFVAFAAGCKTLPSGRSARVPETEWLTAPEAFRPYLHRLIRRVDIEWNREIASLENYPPPGSRVVIRFHVNSAGLVSRIDDVEENAGKQATYACVNAITSPQPYPRWSPGMISALGEEQEITIAFHFHSRDADSFPTADSRNPLPAIGSGD